MRTELLCKIEATAGLGSLSAFGALSVQVEGRQIEEALLQLNGLLQHTAAHEFPLLRVFGYFLTQHKGANHRVNRLGLLLLNPMRDAG